MPHHPCLVEFGKLVRLVNLIDLIVPCGSCVSPQIVFPDQLDPTLNTLNKSNRFDTTRNVSVSGG